MFLRTVSFIVNGKMSTCIHSEKTNNLKVPHLKVKEVFQNLITHEDAEILVKKSVSPDAKLVDFHLRPFSKEKLGYLGSHLSLIVEAREPGKTENQVRNFFIKTFPYEDSKLVAYVEEKGCFRKETRFYGLVVPLMTDNFKGERWAARCFLAKANVMVFENLKPEGFSNRIRLLDEKSVKAAFSSIARMHASSLLAEEQIQGKSLKALYPDVFDESEFMPQGGNYAMQKIGLNLAIELANDMGLDTSNIRRASKRIYELYQSSKTKRNVVCHGDLWSSNVIFDQNDHCRLVDFQMVRYLPPGHDLMLLLYYGAATEVRQKYERQLVEHYYKVLTETLKLNNFKGEPPSFDELLEGIEELRLPALYHAVQFHSLILLDNQTATEIMGNPVSRDNIFFGDRKPIIEDYMAKHPEYKKKIEDNIREFVEMSLNMDPISKDA